jgi:ADP-dependent NAD(P)H-hydrate dehydratase / NAD(P)H-hydrate epimerase
MPMPVLTVAQMRDWEKATWDAGQTEDEVIRRVGQAVACHALRLTRPGELILILAGKGHNGEDARCARTYLSDRRVDLLEVLDPAADFPKLDALLRLRAALVVDGLFGIGLNRPLSREWVRFIQRVNDAQAQILSVDLPSGLHADTGQPQGGAIRASVTLTVGAPKTGLFQESAWPFVGRLEVLHEVGLAPCLQTSELQWTMREDFAGLPPGRSAATHKGSYGHLAIAAGSLGYHGAAVLAARGAQRAQPGLITLYTLDTVYPVIASQLQAVMVSPCRPPAEWPGSVTAILLGPGLAATGIPDPIKGLVRDSWSQSSLPVVVDASGLDWLPPGAVPKGALRVITPHPGEAARLLGSTPQQIQSGRLQALRLISERFGHAWVVLKGHQTLVGRSTGPVYVNSSGNPHLGQGGSGDVLSGFLAGCLAQPALQVHPLKTIRYAVWLHGATADRLQAARSNWVVEELVEHLGAAADLPLRLAQADP